MGKKMLVSNLCLQMSHLYLQLGVRKVMVQGAQCCLLSSGAEFSFICWGCAVLGSSKCKLIDLLQEIIIYLVIYLSSCKGALL